MTHSDRDALIRSFAEPLALDMGLEIWGIEVLGGPRPVLRVFVEARQPKDADLQGPDFPDAASPDTDARAAAGLAGQGVGIEQCAELSRRLGFALEAEDAFPDAWTLEVSSPGFERPFSARNNCRPISGRRST